MHQRADPHWSGIWKGCDDWFGLVKGPGHLPRFCRHDLHTIPFIQCGNAKIKHVSRESLPHLDWNCALPLA
jgi:hypothetical protein